MPTDPKHFGWYAIQVASQKEKPVASVLGTKGYECFLPLYSQRRIWSDRIKVAWAPLFPGYVFSKFDIRSRLPIVSTPHVKGIVGNGKIPEQVPEQELEAVRVALQNGLPIEPCDLLQHGDAVRVTKGPLAGIEGSFVRYRGNYRLIVSVALIERSVAVEIDRVCVEPISWR